MTATTRTVSKHVPQYHYVLLLVSTTSGVAADRATMIQLLQKGLSEWFGTTGGVNSNQVDIVTIQSSTSIKAVANLGSNSTDREVILRFPRSITPQLITALPLLASSNHRIQVLNDSADPSRLSGFAGRGMHGFEAWKEQLFSRAG
ncbi:uncharacterized protein JCM15063_000020 [Sporobolomyces koalae]|uniref:uncharacterized protein n=1 Tax=Sporobolomyces koalae TaxID=500713 RepID=UPI00317F17B0